MKAIIAGIVLFFALLSGGAIASNADEFTFDEAEFYSSFRTLNELDLIIESNPYVAFDELKNTEGISIEGLAALDFMNHFEPPLGIPSFAWGCVLGWVGILITYLVTDGDNDETKKALYGCLVAGASYFVLVILYYVFVIILFASTAVI